MMDRETRLRIVKLMEPTLCRNCRFAKKAIVEVDGGANRVMLNCERRDCDNWNISGDDVFPVSLRVIEGLLP